MRECRVVVWSCGRVERGEAKAREEGAEEDVKKRACNIPYRNIMDRWCVSR